MSDEKEIRKAGDYTIIQSMQIGEKEFVLGENMQAKDGKYYIVANYELCHPNKNGHRKASKNGMNRILSFVFERRPHLFHGSLDNEPLPT